MCIRDRHRLDLKLTGSAHFGMVVLHRSPRRLDVHAHLAAALVGTIQGLCNVVVALAWDNGSGAVSPAVPVGLLRIDGHTDGVRPHIPGHTVKEIELKLRQDQHRVRYAGIPHIFLRRQDDVPGVLVQRAVVGRCV